MQLGQPIPALGQDVVMDMDDGSGAIGAAGKKFFPKKFGGVRKIDFFFLRNLHFPVGWSNFFSCYRKNEAGVGRCPQKANEFPIEKNFDTKKSVDGSE